jgi:hypothetical protein
MLANPRVGSRSDLRFHVPPPRDGSGLESLAQVAGLAREFDRSLDLWAKGAAQRAEVRERRRRALIDTVGGDALKRFRSYSKEQRESNFGLGPTTLDREGLGRLKEAREAAQQGSFELMRELGVDAGRLRALQEEIGRDLMGSIGAAGPSQGAPEPRPDAAGFGPAIVGDVVGDIGPVIDPGTEGGVTGDGWHRRTPPFDGWSWSYTLRWQGGNDPLLRQQGTIDGPIGMTCAWDNSSAGDDDSMELWSYGEVGFWYYVPAEGEMEVQATFGTTWAGGASISLDNEWGWSHAETWLGNMVDVMVRPPGPPLFRSWPGAWHMRTNGAEDATYHVSGPGILTIRTSIPVPGPGWVWVSAETLSEMLIWVDDVSVSASMRAEWIVREMLVRMV